MDKYGGFQAYWDRITNICPAVGFRQNNWKLI